MSSESNEHDGSKPFLLDDLIESLDEFCRLFGILLILRYVKGDGLVSCFDDGYKTRIETVIQVGLQVDSLLQRLEVVPLGNVCGQLSLAIALPASKLIAIQKAVDRVASYHSLLAHQGELDTAIEGNLATSEDVFCNQGKRIREDLAFLANKIKELKYFRRCLTVAKPSGRGGRKKKYDSLAIMYQKDFGKEWDSPGKFYDYLKNLSPHLIPKNKGKPVPKRTFTKGIDREVERNPQKADDKT